MICYINFLYLNKHRSSTINDLVDTPKELVDRYFLKLFQLLDLGQIDDEAIKQHAWSGIMEFALKHIFARDIMPHLRDIAEIMKRVDQSGGSDYIAEEGRMEGEIEIAKRMLDAGSDPVFIAKVTDLSLDKIKSLKNND